MRKSDTTMQAFEYSSFLTVGAEIIAVPEN
jgi:hypothetical protein